MFCYQMPLSDYMTTNVTVIAWLTLPDVPVTVIV